MSSKRICFLASVQGPFEVRMFHREAALLAEVGHDVTIIAQDDCNEVVDGVRIIGIGRPSSRFRRFLRTGKLFLRARKEKADLYQVHNPELLPWGVMLRWVTGRPVIYDVHEDFPGAAKQRHWIPLPLRAPVSWIVDVAEKTLSCWVTAVVAADRQIAERFSIIRDRVITVHNYPRVSYLGELPDRTDIRRASRTVVHIGSLSSERGGEIMIAAFRRVAERVPNAELLLIADFTHGYALNLKLRVVKSDLATQVRFIEYLPHEEVLQRISECAVGLSLLQPVPKFMKNIPQKVFEYMGCGVPCVVTDLPPIHEYIESTGAGILVKPSDVSAIADAMMRLLEDPEEACAMGARGRAAVLDKYNWESESVRLLALYERILGS